MTRQELIEMTGSEEQADYAMEIVLKNIKREFVKQCVKAEVAEIEARISELKTSRHIYTANGMNHVNGNPDFSDGFNEAQGLLYRHNRTRALTAAR